jgi:hypothetical protein
MVYFNNLDDSNVITMIYILWCVYDTHWPELYLDTTSTPPNEISTDCYRNTWQQGEELILSRDKQGEWIVSRDDRERNEYYHVTTGRGVNIITWQQGEEWILSRDNRERNEYYHVTTGRGVNIITWQQGEGWILSYHVENYMCLCSMYHDWWTMVKIFSARKLFLWHWPETTKLQ